MERTRGSMTILANKPPFLYPCQIIKTMMRPIVNGLHICHSSAPPSPLFPPPSPSFTHATTRWISARFQMLEHKCTNTQTQIHKYSNTNTQIPKHKYTNTKTQITNTNPFPHPLDHQVDLSASCKSPLF